MDTECEPIIKSGDKLLACHRRLFENDEPRYFIGEVISSNDSVIKIRGYSHCLDLSTGHFTRKNEIRTKVISIVSGTHILYELPHEISTESLGFVSEGGKVGLRGDGGFSLDMTEYAVHRR